MKLIFGMLVIGLLVLSACTAWKAAMLPVRTVTTQVDSADAIIEKTYDADNAIYNYEWFKTQYEKIDANRRQIKNTVDAIAEFKNTYGNNASGWDSATKVEYNRLNTIKNGLVNQDENLVAEYNARSKMANRAIFQDKLPLYVDRILW